MKVRIDVVNNLSGYINFSGTSSVNAATAKKTAAKKEVSQPKTEAKRACTTETAKAYGTTGIKTALTTETTKEQYKVVSSLINPEAKVTLSELLKSGVLLNNKSNDGSSVLDNLHKMATEPRLRGLNTSTLLTEAIQTIANPESITQTFGDVPESVGRAVFRHPELGVRSKEEMNIGEYSYCCVAASIEYNMASKNPAEFVRMAEGLSSEDYCVTKNMHLSDIAEKPDDAKWLLNKFKLPYALDGDGNLRVTIAPDRNAIIRARVQTSYRDEGERSCLDVLMQSALMNVGSQQTYNALNDTRTGTLNDSNRGLTDLEKTFTEEVFEGKAKESVIYQALDETGRIAARSCDYQTMATQILTALERDNNVIVGYVILNDDEQVVGGHEITIIGAGEAPTGDLYFVCNDTNDGTDEPIYVLAENLLPKLHHAGLPKEVVAGQDLPTAFDGIKYYKETLG